MTRKKVKLTYITNDTARKATFKKRKKGLLKKVSELTTLCDIDACAIIYSPYDSQPEIWPSPLGVHRVLAQFKTMPEMEQSKKMVNQESFLRQRINKAHEQLKKQKKDNREKEMTRIMFQSVTGKSLEGLAMSDLADLTWVIDQHLKNIQLRMKNIKEQVVKSRYQVQGAQGVPTVKDYKLAAMKSNGEGSSNNMAIKSDEEGDNLQYAAPNMQVLDQVHNMETMQIHMMHMENQRQQNPWFMDVNHIMNVTAPPLHSDQHQHIGFNGEDMMHHFPDHTSGTVWSNPPLAGSYKFP